MPSPITPSTVKALIPNGSGSFCDEFKKLIRFIAVFYQWFKYAFDEDGNPSAAFKGDLAGVTTVDVNTVPSKPTGLVASTDHSGLITLTWNATANATSYRIYYNTTDTISGTPLVTGVTSTSYTHTIAAGSYYYWVKAVNALGDSAASDSALGTSLDLAEAPSAAFTAVDTIGTEIEVTVPTSMTKLTVHAWAGGGGGSWGQRAVWGPVQTTAPVGGGGGGGGGYAYKSEYTVVPGQKVKFYRGAGGSIATKGGDSYVKNNAGTDVLRCIGGSPGRIPTGGIGGSSLGTGITKQDGGTGTSGDAYQGGAGAQAYATTVSNQPPQAGWGGDGSLYMQVGSAGGTSAESGQPGAILYAFTA